jgi:hypothetical protein
MLCNLHSYTYVYMLMARLTRTRILEIATNPFAYCVHATALLTHHATYQNRGAIAQYHISEHNFSLNILHWCGSVIRTPICTWSQRAFCYSILYYDCFIDWNGNQPLLCQCRLNDANSCMLRQVILRSCHTVTSKCVGILQASNHQPML